MLHHRHTQTRHAQMRQSDETVSRSEILIQLRLCLPSFGRRIASLKESRWVELGGIKPQLAFCRFSLQNILGLAQPLGIRKRTKVSLQSTQFLDGNMNTRRRSNLNRHIKTPGWMPILTWHLSSTAARKAVSKGFAKFAPQQ